MPYAMVISGFLSLAAVATLSAQAAAPKVPAPQDRGIIGFLSVPWGSKATDVTAAYRAPLMDQTTPDSGHVMIYKDQVLGRSVLALFYVDKAKGLVKGVYSVPYDSAGADCEAVFDKFKTFVQRVFPAIRPVEERKNDTPALPFCAAADSGKASRSAVWTDTNGNSVQITLEPEVDHVDVEFQSRDVKRAPSK